MTAQVLLGSLGRCTPRCWTGIVDLRSSAVQSLSARCLHSSSQSFATSSQASRAPEGDPIATYKNKLSWSDRAHCKIFRVDIPPYHCVKAMATLYTACVDENHRSDIYRLSAMPDTFQSWFLVTQLHIWMCLSRVFNEGRVGRKFAARSLNEVFWKDTDSRIRMLSKEVAGVRRTKALRQFQDQHLAMLMSYEQAMQSDDREMALVLWNTFFTKPETNVANLATMVGYVRRSLYMLDRTPSLFLLTDGAFKFPPVVERQAKTTPQEKLASSKR